MTSAATHNKRSGLAFASLMVAVAVAGVSACTTSEGPQDRSIDAPPRAGDVVVRGTLVAPDERSVTGRTVSAVRIKTGGDVLTDLFTTVFTGGLAALGCLGGDGLIEVCRVGDYSTQTTTGGAFAFRLRAEDITSSAGRRRALDITTGLAPAAGETSGPIVSVRLRPKKGEKAVTIGRMTAWDGAVSASGQDRALSLRWEDPPATGAVAVRLEEPGRGLFISNDHASLPAVIDARIVEDANPTMTVAVKGRVSGRDTVWTSAARPIAGTAGAPASRGVPCTVTVGTASSAVPSSPSRAGCWLVDGHFNAAPRLPRPTSCRVMTDAHGFSDTVCIRAPITSATLDLGSPIPLSLVVLRRSTDYADATGSAVVVEASVDSQRWRPVGEWGGEPFNNQLELQLPRGLSARYVRLRVDGEPRPQPSYIDERAPAREDARAVVSDYRGDLATLAEVSVWKGIPLPLLGPGGKASAAQGDRQVLLLVLAGLLAATLLAAVGYTLGRRTASD